MNDVLFTTDVTVLDVVVRCVCVVGMILCIVLMLIRRRSEKKWWNEYRKNRDGLNDNDDESGSE